MNKNLFHLGASLVAIISLVGCEKTLVEPNIQEIDGIEFELTASSGTKTTMSGFATSWAADDGLSVSHAVAGATEYSDDGKFTISADDLENKVFKGTLSSSLDEESSYDWYALYPYNGQTYTYIGHSKSATQNGNNSTAHLCGSLCPLYGIVKNVESSHPVSFEMKHLAAFVEVEVTNSNETSLTVENINFSSSDEDIVGAYIIDFKGESIVYTARGESYVSETAVLNVKDGEAIAKGESAKFYIPIKPHTAETGSTITISVNGLEKKISLTKDVTFKAGAIKQVSFEYKTEPIMYSTEFNYAAVGTLYNSEEPILGEDTGTATSWSIVYGNWSGSECAQMRVYSGSTGGFGSVYMNFDVSNATRVEYKAQVGATNVKLNTYYSTDKGQTWVKVDSDKSLTTALTTYSFVISSTGEFARNRIKFEASGSRPSSSNTKLTIDDVVIYGNGAIVLDPVLSANDIEVEAAGVSDAVAAYTVANCTDDITVKEFTGCVTSATASAGKITYSVVPNYTDSKTDGTIVLVSASNAELTKTVNVSQAKSTFSVNMTDIVISSVKTSADFTVTTPEFGYNAEVTVAEGMNLTLSATSGEKGSSAQTITVSSTTPAPTEGEAIELGTIKLFRNGNVSDPQAKTVVVKKDVAGTIVYYTKVSAITSGKKYLLVDSNYIFDGSNVKTSTPAIDATSLIDSDRIESNDNTNKYAVTITTSTKGYKILLSTDKYLVINASSSNNGNLTSNTTGEDITIKSVTGGFRFISTNRTTRGMCFNTSSKIFKNYAIDNFGKSPCGGTFVLYELAE